VTRGCDNWQARVVQAGAPPAFAESFLKAPAGNALLAAIFGNSPFLSQLLLAEPRLLQELTEEGLDSCFQSLCAGLGLPPFWRVERAAVMAALRRARKRAALLIAIADLTGAWPLERVTGALSDFAEAALDAALNHLLLGMHGAEQLQLATMEQPVEGSGVVVIGMGKLGARELNYSSDIDLIILFDPERMRPSVPEALPQAMQRLVRDLVALIGERTGDGYVQRVDLRLRPDPGASPLAVSFLAAESYYESLGQNWERAAMIKARAVAGDRVAGQEFLTRLRPFIWRKHLDFAAIQDIHSIKRQINAHKGHQEIAVAGHDIKVGRGGIREIEFYAQTQQLIWGGRLPDLRHSATCPALRALVEAGRTAPNVADDLIVAYRFLRTLEHRIQMIGDEQRHSLPAREAELDALAIFMGFADRAALAATLTGHLLHVENHYAELFEDTPQLGGPEGNLVFTGTDDDPDTLKTLSRLGFSDGSAIAGCIRGWHHGRVRATRSTRARELLTELMPALLRALGRTVNPDQAFMKFNDFIANLPSGVQLFALIYANPRLLDEVAEVMGSAPRLAEQLSRRPGLFDGLLTTDFDVPLPEREALRADFESMLAYTRTFEEMLDQARRFVHDRQFQVGMQLLRQRISSVVTGRNLSDLADVAIGALLPRVENAFAELHGRIEAGRLVIVALGKLGAREMTFDSDLDLIFIYETPQGLDVLSNGARPLAASQYFARLGQRLIATLSALTAEGQLFQVDMRLRPSGAAGPIASEVAGFIRYQRQSAWTFEHQALTRARVVAGDPVLGERVAQAIDEVLRQPRDPGRLIQDVAEMRIRIEAERATGNRWKLKHVRGGLLDLEFLAQYFQLREAVRHPGVLTASTADAFERLARIGVLAPEEAKTLASLTRFMQTLQILLRLTVGTIRDENRFSSGVRQTLCAATGMSDFEALRQRLIDAEAYVQDCFERNIAEAAARFGPARDGEQNSEGVR
jgi:glutamate-ammonia-ligase adenylyltransferase